jgi:hypothetical protein
MKTQSHFQRKAWHENASITLVFVGLLAIMMILVMAESRALSNLHQDLKLMERDQIKRLNGPTSGAVAVNLSQEKTR